MAKIAFIGAGSTIFAKNIIGDVLLTESLKDSHIALYDIDGRRLEESRLMAENLGRTLTGGRAKMSACLGPAGRKSAFRDADFAVNAVQIGGYEPATVTDFEVPKRYGLRQTIGDTLGIGGIFRALRTIPVMLEMAREMEEVCPDVLLLNYTNPMAMVTGGILGGSSVKTVGLCHSVQVCVPHLLRDLSIEIPEGDEVSWKIAGINHMAWLLEVRLGRKDLYPEIRRLAGEKNAAARRPGAAKHDDMVRYEILRHFGYYVTESSEHTAEYSPYWIKSSFPGLVDEFHIPLDEYPRRCKNQIEAWEKQRDEIVHTADLRHERSIEYAADIMNAIVTGLPVRIHGNVRNAGLIPNLPAEAVVEVPCLVDGNGVQGVGVGRLPEQCAALNRTNVNVQLLAIEAALTRKKEFVYQAAYLDPHTAAELPLDDIRSLCDDLFAAHGELLPAYT